ncbi:heterokaryon incompatibility protein-domain-containing protein [Podospora appendiculata]|uniref:Heterokaryon incompatibility protein-domain-containing protein n=1 Tax=Podospora appendiculata TaxID=314037 RepID=A0AAE0XCP3_9PEZI|nr:heterokaryon incompatibility protein-domain-containing protein [Podospora appendiculata]
MSVAVSKGAEALESLSQSDDSRCIENPALNGPSTTPSYQQLPEHRAAHSPRVDDTTCSHNPEPSVSSVFSSPFSNLQLADQHEAKAVERASPQGDSPTSPDALKPHVRSELPHPSPYQQLKRHSREIRILCLLPGLYKDPIRGYLRTANLDDNPHYEALSYVWGDPLICKTSFIDKQPIDVTINLFLALRRIRHRRRGRHIWVDAICINQSDDIEKTHQVNLMRHIYPNTAHAILWLCEFSHNYSFGSDNVLPQETFESAFDLIEIMAEGGHFYPTDPSKTYRIDNQRVDALSDIMNLSWWHRIWTVQEAVLPGRASIRCGSIQLDFSVFLTALFRTRVHLRQQCCGNLKILNSFWSTAGPLARLKQNAPSPISFIYSLHQFKARLASDPRDKVFALLGLGGTAISANYELPLYKDVILSLVHGLIVESKEIFVLLRTAERNRSPDLPTWAPDLCAELDLTTQGYIGQMGRFAKYRYYNAAAGTLAETGDTGSESLLALQGLVVDEILEIGKCYDDVDQTLEVTAEWRNVMIQAREINYGTYPRGGTYEQAFWRMMATGIEWSPNFKASCEVPRSYGGWFFVTRNGLIGVCHSKVEVGDAVYVLLGGRMPFVLRPSKGHEESIKSPCYEYVGQTYVHGFMDGEVMREGREPQWITLV